MKIVEIGLAKLYLGDCKDILPILDKVDLCLTDPPYGIGLAGGFGGFGGFGAPISRKQYEGDWDNVTPDKELFNLFLNLANESIVWGGNYFTDKLPCGEFWLVWDKQNTMPTFSDCELAWTNIAKKSVKRIVYMQNGCMTKSKEKERFHPTQKPVDVMKWCIEQCKKNPQTILDPFMGSGTTGVGAVQMGRKFIGIEREEKYFDIACRRIEEAQKQGDIFIAPIFEKPKNNVMEFE